MTKLQLITKTLDEHLATDIKIIDFQNTHPFFDYYVIATILNDRMANGMLNYLQQALGKNNLDVKKVDFNENSGWYILEVNGIMIHLFTKEQRVIYNLEKLWSHLPIMEANNDL